MIEMKDLTATYTLANGVKIPVLGLGTGQAPDSEATIKAVKTAIEIGYRHIDTAQVYENETSIGGAIQQSGVSRKELFVTTKIWNDQHTYDKALASFEESLEKLATDYVDLLLVHWPNPPEFRDHWQQANKETWRGLEALYRVGKARAIEFSATSSGSVAADSRDQADGQPDVFSAWGVTTGRGRLLSRAADFIRGLFPTGDWADLPSARDHGIS